MFTNKHKAQHGTCNLIIFIFRALFEYNFFISCVCENIFRNSCNLLGVIEVVLFMCGQYPLTRRVIICRRWNATKWPPPPPWRTTPFRVFHHFVHFVRIPHLYELEMEIEMEMQSTWVQTLMCWPDRNLNWNMLTTLDITQIINLGIRGNHLKASIF